VVKKGRGGRQVAGLRRSHILKRKETYHHEEAYKGIAERVVEVGAKDPAVAMELFGLALVFYSVLHLAPSFFSSTISVCSRAPQDGQ